MRRLSGRRSLPAWLPWAACLAVVAWPALSGFNNWREDRQVAGLFRQGRPTELRLAGMPYGPLAVERGGVAPRPASDIPVADPERAARRAFLERDPRRAVQLLRQAQRDGSVSSALQNDLAVGYAMQGDARRAIELLDAVLAAEPANTIALFNRAILAARAGTPPAGNQALDRLLRYESEAVWRDEARKLSGTR